MTRPFALKPFALVHKIYLTNDTSEHAKTHLSPPLLHLRGLGPRVALVLVDPLGEVVSDGGDPLQLPEVIN